MKKNKYLFSLRNKLMWKHSTKDINSVIYDYNEYFNIGISNGKSEYEMVIDLGTPSDVAKALEDEMDIWAPIKLIGRLFLGCILILYTYIYLLNIYNHVNIIGISVVFTCITPLGIWLLIGGDLRYQHIDNNSINFSNFRKLMIVLGLFFFVSIINISLIIYTANFILINEALPFGIENTNARIYFNILFHFTSVIGALTTIQIVSSFRRTFINTLPLLFIVAGVIYSIQSLINKFSNTKTAADLFSKNTLLFCLFPILSGIILSALSYYLIRLLDKRGR